MKYLGNPAITFEEFPDEIALCFNITNCPGTCQRCSEPELRQDVGTVITEDLLTDFIESNPGATMVGFLGGDADHSGILNFTKFIHSKFPNMKVGFYSGRNYIDLELAQELDYYKIGEFRMFTGKVETWKDQTAGPICLPTSNQVMFKKVDGKLINITDEFRKRKIRDWTKTIL